MALYPCLLPLPGTIYPDTFHTLLLSSSNYKMEAHSLYNASIVQVIIAVISLVPGFDLLYLGELANISRHAEKIARSASPEA